MRNEYAQIEVMTISSEIYNNIINDDNNNSSYLK